MAVVKSIAIGKGKGKVGNIVLSTVKGRCIAREYQDQVKNPQKPAQVAQRNKMKNIVAIYGQLAPALQGAFANRAKLLSVYNAFVKANVHAAPDTSFEDFVTLWYEVAQQKPNFRITNGSLGEIQITEVANGANIDFHTIASMLKAGDKVTKLQFGEYGNAGSGQFTLREKTQELTAQDIASGYIEIQDGGATEKGIIGAYITTANGKKSSNCTFVWCENA